MAVASFGPVHPGPMVPTGRNFAAMWETLDKPERDWVDEAVARGRTADSPELALLIVARAWRLQERAFRGSIGVAAFGVVLLFATLSFGSVIGPGLGPLVVAPVTFQAMARRYSAAIARNLPVALAVPERASSDSS